MLLVQLVAFCVNEATGLFVLTVNIVDVVGSGDMNGRLTIQLTLILAVPEVAPIKTPGAIASVGT